MLIRTIYVYLISAVTLVMAIVGSITLISSALSLTVFTGYVETYEDFVRNRCLQYTDIAASAPTPIEPKTHCDINTAVADPAWKERYDVYKNDMKEMDKRQKIDRMIKAIPLIFVPLPVFFLFQKKRREL